MFLSSTMSGPLTCTSMQTRSQSARFFASPPSSPPATQSQPTFPSSLMGSCHSLQSIMSAQVTSPFYHAADELPLPEMTELPTPPLAYATPPLTRSNTNGANANTNTNNKTNINDNTNTTSTPTSSKKLLVRSRARSCHHSTANDRVLPRKRIVKRAPTPTPSPNKRRRPTEGDSHDGDYPVPEADDELNPQFNAEIESAPGVKSEPGVGEWHTQSAQEQEPELQAPSTPKRSRIAPEQLPLGLDRSDFHRQFQDDLNLQQQQVLQRGTGTDVVRERGDELWSVEDDKILVELVLAKMKLKPEEWRDCAQAMGRDRHSLDRRWKSLMANNHVGLNRRRTKIHATWR